jgi:hypothetical protein
MHKPAARKRRKEKAKPRFRPFGPLRQTRMSLFWVMIGFS